MGRSLTRTPVAALDDLGGGPRPRSPSGSTPRCSGYCVRWPGCQHPQPP